VKYYDGRPKAQQIEFEAALHKKTKTVSSKNESKYSSDLYTNFDKNIVFFISFQVKYYF
jgi:hypothetical protein